MSLVPIATLFTAQEIFLVIMVAIAGLLILDRLLIWMGSRGWIYWRKDKPKSGGGGGMSAGLNVFRSFVEPEVRHVIVDRDQRRMADAAEQGAAGTRTETS